MLSATRYNQLYLLQWVQPTVPSNVNIEFPPTKTKKAEYDVFLNRFPRLIHDGLKTFSRYSNESMELPLHMKKVV